MTSQKFAVDQLVLESASVLTPAHFESFSRLCKKVVYGPDFQLLLVDCRDQLLQQQLQKLLSAVCQKAGFAENQLSLSADIPDVFELQQRLQQLAVSHQLIQLTQAAAWFNVVPDGKRWQEFNLLRENIAQSVNCKLVLWLDETAINQMINQAPDWWAWRSGVYTFSSEYVVSTSLSPKLSDINRRNLNKSKVAARIAELHSWLEQQGASEPELSLSLLLELGDLYRQRGDIDIALDIYEHLLNVLENTDDARAVAVTLGRIADVKYVRGDLDEALDIVFNKELPVYTQLGDIHAIAVTYDKIADIYKLRGQLDSALSILLNNCLPMFENIGDLREVAITQRKMADIYELQGAFDKALAIRLDKELPIFEQSGDLREIALTKGRVADIKQSQGSYDEALAIRIEEELPVFEKLGDIRELAVVKSKIADIHEIRGEIDTAISIRLEYCLPLFERIGDSYGILVSKTEIARLWIKRGNPSDSDRARQFLEQALAIANKMDVPEKTYVQNLLRTHFQTT
jgi:tetratricopeptide (TPR) repeat protein